MLKIINAADKLSDYFPDERFSMKQWDKYIDTILPRHKHIFVNDMQETIQTGMFTFENDFLPVLSEALRNNKAREKLLSAFRIVTENLDARILKTMGRSIDATLILYLGLCNGAGWVVNLDAHLYVLLGIEKIIELGWYGTNDLYGLIYHELGHIYQMQYGQLARPYVNGDAFLWQLFTEGIAMLFEQKLIGNNDYFHQDRDGWANWCAEHFSMILHDFSSDMATMTRDNQRYFGDWVRYHGYPDVGYYLGARFVQWINTRHPFDAMVNFDIEAVRSEWTAYLGMNPAVK